MTFTLTGESSSVTLTKPDHGGEDNSVNNDIVLFDFWSNNLDTSFEGIATRPLTLTGVEKITDDSFDKFIAINTMMDNHEKVTISGLGDCMDGVYIVSNFQVNSIKGTSLGVKWNLSLELVRRI